MGSLVGPALQKGIVPISGAFMDKVSLFGNFRKFG